MKKSAAGKYKVGDEVEFYIRGVVKAIREDSYIVQDDNGAKFRVPEEDLYFPYQNPLTFVQLYSSL